MKQQRQNLLRNPRLWLAIAVAATALLSLSVAFDWLPALRGHISHDPKVLSWQWQYQPGWRVVPLFQMLIALALLLTTAWLSFATGSRTARAALFALTCLGGTLFQYGAVGFRHADPAVNLAWRTEVNFLEDFFDAARATSSPAQAYTDLDTLRREYGHARLHTHPPGMTALYRALATAQEAAPALTAPAVSAFRTFFKNDSTAAALPDPWLFALGLGTVIKAGGLWLALLGAVFLVKAFTRPGHVANGQPLAVLIAVVPGVALFSACIDQLIMGFTALSAGLVLWSYRSPRRWWAAIAAGASLFLQSQLGYQVIAVGWIIGLVTVLLFIQRSSRRARKQIIFKAAATAGLFLLLLVALYARTGYNYFEDLTQGLAAHRLHPSQVYRSRTAWLFYNNWDMLLFAGCGWLALVPFIRFRVLLRHPFTIALISLWLILLARDSVRGETARIMLFFYPLGAAALWVALRQQPRGCVSGVAVLLALQAIVFAGVLNLF